MAFFNLWRFFTTPAPVLQVRDDTPLTSSSSIAKRNVLSGREQAFLDQYEAAQKSFANCQATNGANCQTSYNELLVWPLLRRLPLTLRGHGS